MDTSTNGTFTVDTGATSSQVEGKTLIVHAHNGARIACAILSTGENGAFEATAFVKYYTYTGSLEVGGLVGPMSTSGDSQSFTYSLTGVDGDCSGGADPNTKNSCGIHIHKESTCTDDAGGHYYNTATDPWATVNYTSTSDGTTTGTTSALTELETGELNGKAFIVHNYAGGRIACAILGAVAAPLTLTAAGFVPYYSYTGPLVRRCPTYRCHCCRARPPMPAAARAAACSAVTQCSAATRHPHTPLSRSPARRRWRAPSGR